MAKNDDAVQQHRTQQTAQQSVENRSAVIGSEVLHVRNYDHQWGYDLSIEAVDESGRSAFETRYYLQPGQVESELGVLRAGTYEIHATLDNLEEASLECQIGESPDHTVVVEVGNGALSLTEGLLG